VHNPNPRVDIARQQMGMRQEYLYPNFLCYALVLISAGVFCASMFAAYLPSMSGLIAVSNPWIVPISIVIVMASAWISIRRVNLHLPQVQIELANLSGEAEPQQADARSVEGEFAIEHPLLAKPGTVPSRRSLELFCEGTWLLQEGKQASAMPLYDEALTLDPDFHQHAIQALAPLLPGSNPQDAGAIYYWLGIHSEYLNDWGQAAGWYEQAAQAFHQLGYAHRESRARCNLGHVKEMMRDPTMMDEWESAVHLNPNNGTAWINIGTTYYMIGEQGSANYDKAMDAYAGAVLADPQRYGPIVIARLRRIGYTWQEDLDEITRRVEDRRKTVPQ
jgi:tetratricopeptide (TPR) repeat protein